MRYTHRKATGEHEVKVQARCTFETFTLKKETHQTAQRLLFDEHREFGELVDQLVGQWVSRQNVRSSKV